MTRKFGWLLSALLGLATAAAGCKDLEPVADYGGSKIYVTMSGAKPTPVGAHLELWARNGDQEIIRLQPDTGVDDQGRTKQGTLAYTIVPAVDINDPCMVDTGNDHDGTYELIWKPGSQPGPSDAEKIVQAKAVEDRIHQLTDLQPTPLYALVAYDDLAYSIPSVCAGAQKVAMDPTAKPADKVPIACTTNADCKVGFCGKPCLPDESCQSVCVKRKEYCNCIWSVGPCGTDWSKNSVPAYVGNCPNVNAQSQIYTGDPRQLTNPIHGQFYAAVDFLSVKPSQISGGMKIESPFAIRDVRELWFTQTKATIGKLDQDQIDCAASPSTCRGPIYLQGAVDVFGRDVVHFDLTSPDHSVSGTAAVYTQLGRDPVSF
jgi:hypothetical protein